MYQALCSALRTEMISLPGHILFSVSDGSISLSVLSTIILQMLLCFRCYDTK